MDCDTAYNLGCNGGIVDYAFAFIISNGGIDTEDDYPYKGHEDNCNWLRVYSSALVMVTWMMDAQREVYYYWW